MHHHRDAGVLAQLPERVEVGEPRRQRRAVGLRDRGRTDQNGLGAAVEAPLELGHRWRDAGEGDDRRRDDAVLVVEGPVVEQPLVVRVHDRVRELEISLHVLLEQPCGGGEQHATVDALLVHQP